MADKGYFHTDKRGEVFELRKALHDSNKNRKKDALKKVIAAITVGKDVSSLFPDVVNCMQTTNIELKKLVYLYVINYARSQPSLAILAVNTFRNDSMDANPLIRGLAIRTMGCIRLDQITEYLVEPLMRCCRDGDPYVRKTAAMCVAKLFDVSPVMVEDQGFLDILRNMLEDANPMVVANSVAALGEISEISGKSYLKDFINSSDQSVSKLLAALNECTEWGQVFLLDALALYDPSSASDAESVLERVTARLSHANSAVILSATKIVMKLLNFLEDEDSIRTIQRKLSPPLVTLLSAEPEIQYVALRNMNLIVQKRPSILASDVKMFFCKYNDPIYVKMEKIDIMVRLISERNIDQVLLEFKEYATEVDVDFVRSAVRAIGRSAIKIESAAEKCINVLLDLIESRVNYVVQEAIVVIKDIFRKYPNRYESIISALCENLDSLDEPEARASMVWIMGEYAERIDNADELLDSFLDGFHDESPSVQLQILTATVKLFLKRYSSTQDLVTRVLKMSTEECNNPDVRDRAYIYWRLLSRAPEAARKVILCEKAVITDDAYSLDSKLLDKLIENISMLASVYHKPPDTFAARYRAHAASDDEYESDYDSAAEEDIVERTKKEMQNEEYESGDEEGDGEEGSDQTSDEGDPQGDIDLLEDFNQPAKPTVSQLKIEKRLVLAASQMNAKGVGGLEIHAGFRRHNGEIELHFTFSNRNSTPLSQWVIQFNKNSFGLNVAAPLQLPVLAINESSNTVLKIKPNSLLSNTAPSNPLVIHAAVKCTLGVFYFSIPFDLSIVIAEGKGIEREIFRQKWQQYGDSKQHFFFAKASISPFSQSTVNELLKKKNIYFIAHRPAATFETMYYSCLTVNNLLLLAEVSLQKEGDSVKITLRSDATALLPLARELFINSLNVIPA